MICFVIASILCIALYQYCRGRKSRRLETQLEYSSDEQQGIHSPINDVRVKAAQPSVSGWLDRYSSPQSSRSHPGRIYLDDSERDLNENENVSVVENDADIESMISSNRTVVRRFSFRNEAEGYFYNPASYRRADTIGRRISFDSL